MSKIDKQSDTWREVQGFAQDAAVNEITTLATHGLPIEETEYRRGRLAAFNEMLALANTDDKPIAARSADYGFGTRIDA